MGRSVRFAVLLLALLAFAGAVHLGAHLTSELDESCDLCLSPARFELPAGSTLGVFELPCRGEVCFQADPVPEADRLGSPFGRAPPF